MNATGFTTSFQEWQYMEHDKRLSIQCIDELACAACQPIPHSLHIDANMKLFVYDRKREPWREAYLADRLFLSSELVVQHINDLDAAMGKQVTQHVLCFSFCAFSTGSRQSFFTWFCAMSRRMIVPVEACGLLLGTGRVGQTNKMSISGSCFGKQLAWPWALNAAHILVFAQMKGACDFPAHVLQTLRMLTQNLPICSKVYDTSVHT